MNKKIEHSVTIEDFSSLEISSEFLEKKVESYNLKYNEPSKEERDSILLRICNYLFEEEVVQAGKHRKIQWEDGWKENLEEFAATKDMNSLVPKYFDKHPVQRLNGEFILPSHDKFEIGIVSLFQYAIFEKYFKKSHNVYEFGAGTGHNLLRLREINNEANLFSMEWAKSGVDLINLVAKEIGDRNLSGRVFDNFNPDESITLEENSGVYTFASLEQLGEATDNIINFWIKNKPSIVVNVEPMSEPLDEKDLLQFLSIKYFEKRKYLKNYITKLKALEESGIIKIHDQRKTGFGSLFIEGYSVIAWSPL